ncbi:unnamed protein product, partial [marine sediment metagenome]
LKLKTAHTDGEPQYQAASLQKPCIWAVNP